MDSKPGFPASSYETDEPAPPPSYSDALSTYQKPIPSYGAPSNTSQYYSSQIQHQLQDLTSTISSLQTQKTLLSHAQDEKILSLLTHQIQIYLSDFANSGLEKGSLILVPLKGVEDESALPSQYDFKDPEHFDKVVRVSDKEDGYGSSGQSWYWDDRDMALRLAGYLRPKTLPPRKEELKAQQQESSSSTSRGFWGRKKKEERTPLIPEPGSIVKAEVPKKEGDRVIMDVKAEEVVFRTENAFGLYESKRGWAVVLKLRVVMAK